MVAVASRAKREAVGQQMGSLNKIAVALAFTMAMCLTMLEVNRNRQATTVLKQLPPARTAARPAWCGGSSAGSGGGGGGGVDSRISGLAQCGGDEWEEKDPTGFPAPEFGPGGGQYAESDYGWTTSGTLDNKWSAAFSTEDYPRSPPGTRRGSIKEYKGRAPNDLPLGEVAARGGLSNNCGCAICPCRGDGDLDLVDNGDWAWPIETRPLPEDKLAAVPAPPPVPELPCCKESKKVYTAKVKPIPRRFEARVFQPDSQSSSSSSSSSSHEKIVYKTLYKEKTVYVPVYDDPYWNPALDGRLSGEGVGMPEETESGALAYRDGAWFEGSKRRRTLLDGLGGTVDSDRDVDTPVDLGVWWPDSLPRDGLAASLSDGYEPSNSTADNDYEA